KYFCEEILIYNVHDGVNNTDVVTVSLTLTNVIRSPYTKRYRSGVNKNGSLTVTAPGVLSNDVDLDGNPMSAVLVATTSHGTLNLSTNGGFNYTPSSNYFCADRFTYQINRGEAQSGVG